MARIDRNPARIAPDGYARPLQPLLPSVVAWLAQGLPVIDIPKQRLIPLVRSDVVNHCCSGSDSERRAVAAQWMTAKVCCPGLLPSAVVATLSAACSLVHQSVACVESKNPAARGIRGFLFERVPAIKPVTARGSICWVVYSKHWIYLQWYYLHASGANQTTCGPAPRRHGWTHSDSAD